MIFTARVRSTRKVLFSQVSVCSHLGGGGYLPSGQGGSGWWGWYLPWPEWGVPTLAGVGVPTLVGVPTFPGLDGGVPS